MRLVTVMIFLGALSACSYQPAVDPHGVDMAHYDADRAYCRDIARQARSGEKVAGGALIGAAVGAATGAVVGEAGEGAAIGAITGTAGGALGAGQERNRIVRNCMRDRGYRVYD